jgi:hypothetical protein
MPAERSAIVILKLKRYFKTWMANALPAGCSDEAAHSHNQHGNHPARSALKLHSRVESGPGQPPRRVTSEPKLNITTNRQWQNQEDEASDV